MLLCIRSLTDGRFDRAFICDIVRLYSIINVTILIQQMDSRIREMHNGHRSCGSTPTINHRDRCTQILPLGFPLFTGFLRRRETDFSLHFPRG